MPPRTIPNRELVASYVASRQLKDSGENRALIIKTMQRYPGGYPGSVEALLAYVDRMLLR